MAETVPPRSCQKRNPLLVMAHTYTQKRFGSSDVLSVMVKLNLLLSFTSLNLCIKNRAAADGCNFWCLVILYPFKERIVLVYVLEYNFFRGEGLAVLAHLTPGISCD